MYRRQGFKQLCLSEKVRHCSIILTRMICLHTSEKAIYFLTKPMKAQSMHLYGVRVGVYLGYLMIGPRPRPVEFAQWLSRRNLAVP